MSEKFDSKFHKMYVRGDGEVVERPIVPLTTDLISGLSYEEMLAEYRWYVGDSTAQLPQELLERLIITGRV